MVRMNSIFIVRIWHRLCTELNDQQCDVMKSLRQPDKAIVTITHIVQNKKILQAWREVAIYTELYFWLKASTQEVTK